MIRAWAVIRLEVLTLIVIEYIADELVARINTQSLSKYADRWWNLEITIPFLIFFSIKDWVYCYLWSIICGNTEVWWASFRLQLEIYRQVLNFTNRKLCYLNFSIMDSVDRCLSHNKYTYKPKGFLTMWLNSDCLGFKEKIKSTFFIKIPINTLAGVLHLNIKQKTLIFSTLDSVDPCLSLCNLDKVMWLTFWSNVQCIVLLVLGFTCN